LVGPSVLERTALVQWDFDLKILPAQEIRSTLSQ